MSAHVEGCALAVASFAVVAQALNFGLYTRGVCGVFEDDARRAHMRPRSHTQGLVQCAVLPAALGRAWVVQLG